MRHTLLVPSLTALSLIAPALTPQARGQVAAPPPPTQPVTQPVTPNAPAPFKTVTELDKGVLFMFQDSKGNYWFSHDFGKGSGLYRWSGKGNTFDHFTTESGLPDNGVGRIQEDKAGHLYIKTHSGITKFDGRTFNPLKLNDAEPAVTELTLSPDILWFGAGGDDPHATYYDGTSLRRLKLPKNADGEAFEAKWPRATYPRRACPYDAYTIYTDTRGHVWFGTANLGALRFDGKSFAWISEAELEFNERDNRTFGTRSIIEDKDGKFWITVSKYRFDMNPPPGAATTRSSGGFAFIKSPGLPHPKPGEIEDYTFIMSMVNDKAGDLWMVTYGAGVWRYDGEKLTGYSVTVDGQPITTHSIYKDREGSLWLSTHENGMFKFNGKAFEKATFK